MHILKVYFFCIKNLLFFSSFIAKLLSNIFLLIFKKKSYAIFIGHKGTFSGNAAAIFESFNHKSVKKIFILFRNKKYFIKYPNNNKREINYFELLLLFFNSKIIVTTTPGFIWFPRKLLGSFAITIHVGNGFPLKEPGLISRHFKNYKKEKYRFFWDDFNYIFCGSRLEMYLSSSSLSIPIKKFKVTGNARNIYMGTKDIREKIKTIYPELPLFTKLILYAPTHRSFESKINDSLSEVLKKKDAIKKFNLKLAQKKIILFTRSHYVFSENIPDSSNIYSLNADKIDDINPFLYSFDSLITDYSGIFLDLLGNEFKIGLIRLEGDDFEINRGLALPDIWTSNIFKITNLEELISFVESPKESNYKNQSLANLFNEYDGETSLKNCLNAINIILKNK